MMERKETTTCTLTPLTYVYAYNACRKFILHATCKRKEKKTFNMVLSLGGIYIFEIEVD